MLSTNEQIQAELERVAGITISPCPSSSPFLKVHRAGICQTDRKAFCSPPSSMTLPRILGHEVCGQLSREVNGLVGGSRVVLWPALTCGICNFCKSGRENLCPKIQLFGCHLDGGFASAISLPENLINRLICLPLPDSLTFSQAVFAEPLGCVLHGLQKIGSRQPASLLIIGGGLMGRLAARAAGALWPGCRVAIFDNNEKRLANCRNEGGNREPGPAELVLVAASAARAFYYGLERLRPGGTIVLFSGFNREERKITLDHNLLHRREQRLAGAYGCCPTEMKQALELMAEGDVQVDDLISRTISLHDLDSEFTRELTVNDYKTIIL